MHLTKYNKQFTVYMNMIITSPLRISESAKLYGSLEVYMELYGSLKTNCF